MRWTVAALLRPITFVLAIVAAVITGDRTDSFWFGLLAFLIALGAGRVLGALIRARPDRALSKAIWPGAATGFAFLFAALGLPTWANFLLSCICATMTRAALAGAVPRRRTVLTVRAGGWRRALDLDELLP